MKIEILQQPDSAIAKVEMAPREEMVAEAGAMVAMSEWIQASTTLRRGKGGGLMGGLKRVLAGESLFLSVFRTASEPGELFLAPQLMGDMRLYEMTAVGLVVQASGYLASTPGVDIDLGFQGFRSLLSGESIFWLDLSGAGYVLLSSFGAIYEIEVDGEYVVDTGHIVAFEKGLQFSISKANPSWWGAFFGGEGFVCRFKGRGKVYCQTHHPGAFGLQVGPKLPPR